MRTRNRHARFNATIDQCSPIVQVAAAAGTVLLIFTMLAPVLYIAAGLICGSSISPQCDNSAAPGWVRAITNQPEITTGE